MMKVSDPIMSAPLVWGSPPILRWAASVLGAVAPNHCLDGAPTLVCQSCINLVLELP